MGKYKGFTCDSCGAVLDDSTRTKKRTSFEGPAADGSYTEDLCGNCVVIPDGVNYKATKRRGGNKAETAAAAPTPQPEDGGVAGPLGDPTPEMSVPAGAGG